MHKFDRKTLAHFLPSPQAIATFERLLGDVNTMPGTIEEAHAVAAQALAAAASALAMLAETAAQLEQLAAAPMQQEAADTDDFGARAQLGTISTQNHDAVDITGGSIGLDQGTVAAPIFYLVDRETGLYRIDAHNLGVAVDGVKLLDLKAELAEIVGQLKVTKQIEAAAPDGTPPFIVTSTALVELLYVARAALADEATHALTANYATDAGTADALSAPTTFPANATDLPTVIALANALRAAAIAKGL